MRQAGAEAATTDVVLSPASIFAAAAGAAAAAHGRVGRNRRTHVATWAWIGSGIATVGLGTAGGWTGLLGRASSWLRGIAGAALAIAAEPAATSTGSGRRDEPAWVPAACAAAAAVQASPLCSPTPLGAGAGPPATRAVWAAVIGAAAANITWAATRRVDEAGTAAAGAATPGANTP